MRRTRTSGSGESGSMSTIPILGRIGSLLVTAGPPWPGSTRLLTCWPNTRPIRRRNRSVPTAKSVIDPIGLLRRREVTVGTIRLIGKESNRLEEREAGELGWEDSDQWHTTYEDHDEWYRIMLPRLHMIG